MKYPTGIKKLKKNISYGNRGMTLENELNETNNFYLINNIAVIHKKPTPITISKVDYPNRKEAVIKEAYFKTPSTTDYNGLYKGKYIDFEAKETKCDNFPISNIHNHQIEHLKKIMEHGGISFLIIRFTLKNETFLLETKELIDFLNTSKRKSIPYEFFIENGYMIQDKFNPRVDYLEIINNLYFNELKGEII
jgi:recombination protein U